MYFCHSCHSYVFGIDHYCPEGQIQGLEAKLTSLRQFKHKAIALATLIKNYPTYHSGHILYTIEDIRREATDLLAERGKDDRDSY